MRVFASADGLTLLVVVAALADGGVDVGLVVAGGAAGVDTLALSGRSVIDECGWGDWRVYG